MAEEIGSDIVEMLAKNGTPLTEKEIRNIKDDIANIINKAASDGSFYNLLTAVGNNTTDLVTNTGTFIAFPVKRVGNRFLDILWCAKNGLMNKVSGCTSWVKETFKSKWNKILGALFVIKLALRWQSFGKTKMGIFFLIILPAIIIPTIKISLDLYKMIYA